MKIHSDQLERNKFRQREVKNRQMQLREAAIDRMGKDTVLANLKENGIACYGNVNEKKDRLKKHFGIQNDNKNAGGLGPFEAIKQIEQKREERRKKMDEERIKKEIEKVSNAMAGRLVDVDFDLMIRDSRLKAENFRPHASSEHMRICICVRKRPIFKKEEAAGEIDAVSVVNPRIRVHECKFKVDGITKHVENHDFTYDNAYSCVEDTQEVYKATLGPLGDQLFTKGVVTCFAYG